ncbi:hypothetical protein PLICRDRAFT_171385 [Plicaturopsis crispa FD-325 SS-3]|nr:hypothetical protein PLICRDRAFT_171385 [Plicaturopsis crispa FD-325 SS-3]
MRRSLRIKANTNKADKVQPLPRKERLNLKAKVGGTIADVIAAHAPATLAHERSNSFVPTTNVVVDRRFLTERTISYGSGGTVVLCLDLYKNSLVAIKVIHAENRTESPILEPEDYFYEQLQQHGGNEIQHFAELLDVFEHKHHSCLVYPLYGRNLAQLPTEDENFYLLKQHQRAIALQIVCGMRYLHEIGVIHSDLKPDNIVLESSATVTFKDVDAQGHIITRVVLKNPKIRILDLGNAIREDLPRPAIIGSTRYTAPEVTLGFPYSYTVDSYGVGCIVAELYLRRYLFPAMSTIRERLVVLETVISTFPPDYASKIERKYPGSFSKTSPRKVIYPEQNDLAPERFIDHSTLPSLMSSVTDTVLRSFLMRMLNVHPNRRMNMEDALHHEYFARAMKD